MLADHANAGEFEIGEEDFAAQARKELRSWIKLSLVVEREGRVYATDAFEEALRFVIVENERCLHQLPPLPDTVRPCCSFRNIRSRATRSASSSTGAVVMPTKFCSNSWWMSRGGGNRKSHNYFKGDSPCALPLEPSHSSYPWSYSFAKCHSP